MLSGQSLSWLLLCAEPRRLQDLTHKLVQAKENGKFGCRIIFPHPKKAELDEFAYLPDELLADNEEDAKQRGSLAGLNHIAGVLLASALSQPAPGACAQMPCTLVPHLSPVQFKSTITLSAQDIELWSECYQKSFYRCGHV